MMNILATLIKAFYPLIKVFFPNFKFSPVSDGFATTTFAKIKDVVEQKQVSIPKKASKELAIERVDQMLINEANKEYACQYSFFCMAGSFIGKKKLIPEQYDDVCVNAGAMTREFWIKDHDKMLVAAGLSGYKTEIAVINKENVVAIVSRIVESINNNLPVCLSLAGKHYELISGYEYVNDELLLKIIDPGGWKDTHAETSTLRMFKFGKDNSRIYSTKSGVQRTITSVRFIVKK